MDEESIFQEFDKLERRLVALIERCDTFRATNAELETRVSALEEELRQKTAQENRLFEERNMVRSRIDSLLSKVNESVGAEHNEVYE